MDINYHTLKSAIYVSLSLFGTSLLFIAWYLKKLAPYSSDPAFDTVPAIILTLVGMTCIFFGVQTFFLRDDPDIWE